VSVQGELQRVLGSYVELLEASGSREAERCAAALREVLDSAPAGGRELERAARRVGGICGTDGRAAREAARSTVEREALADQEQHLLALCRAVAGPRLEGGER